MAEGEDWASYQGASPSAAGLDFVGVKVTEGIGYVNPFWRVQLAIVRAAGAVPLLYHYPHFANGVASELKHFLDTLGPDLQAGDALFLDYEGYDSANAGIPMARQIAYKATWLQLIGQQMPTHQNGTYANTDYLRQDPDGPYGDALWIATAGRPNGEPGITHPWLFHQWSVDQVDRDYTPLSRAELQAWAHSKELDDMPYTPTQLVEFAQQGAAAALADPNARRLAVADNLWWWQHAIDGNVPAGASPAVTAAILDIHKAFATLAAEAPAAAPHTAADAPAETAATDPAAPAPEVAPGPVQVA